MSSSSPPPSTIQKEETGDTAAPTAAASLGDVAVPMDTRNTSSMPTMLAADDDDGGAGAAAAPAATSESELLLLLSKGLPSSNVEAFWKQAWPVLEENGWSKTITPSGTAVVLVVPSASTATTPNKGDFFATAVPGVDYYERIVDVLLRIQTTTGRSRTPAEATAADQYRRAVGATRAATPQTEAAPLDDNDPILPRKKRRATRNARMIDESWKDAGRRRFPKKRTSIGEEFQVTDIPVAGALMETDEPESLTYAELLWDPQQALAQGISDDNDPIAQLSNPHLREAALIALAKSGYDISKFRESCGHSSSTGTSSTTTGVVLRLQPYDGSDWTTAQREAFHHTLFRLRRDLPAVARALSLPLSICQAYYLGTYKYLDAYRVLKAICIDERNQQQGGRDRSGGEDVLDACEVCGDGGDLIICDACELEYHIDCCQPPLQHVPEGRWECDACVDQGVLLHVRDANVKNYTQLFEPVADKKEATTYKPTAWALEMAESFVLGIQKAMHSQEEEDKEMDQPTTVDEKTAKPVVACTSTTEAALTGEASSGPNEERSTTNAVETEAAATNTGD